MGSLSSKPYDVSESYCSAQEHKSIEKENSETLDDSWIAIHLRRRKANDQYEVLTYSPEESFCQVWSRQGFPHVELAVGEIAVFCSRGALHGEKRYLGRMVAGCEHSLAVLRGRAIRNSPYYGNPMDRSAVTQFAFRFPINGAVCSGMDGSLYQGVSIGSAHDSFPALDKNDNHELLGVLETMGYAGAGGATLGAAMLAGHRLGSVLGGLLGASCGVVVGAAFSWAYLKLKSGGDPFIFEHDDWEDRAAKKREEFNL